MKNYYYLLGLNRNASDDDIKKAYRELSKKFHPDVNDGDLYFTERFKDIQEAYEVLSDSKLKSNYDNIEREIDKRFVPYIDKFECMHDLRLWVELWIEVYI